VLTMASYPLVAVRTRDIRGAIAMWPAAGSLLSAVYSSISSSKIVDLSFGGGIARSGHMPYGQAWVTRHYISPTLTSPRDSHHGFVRRLQTYTVCVRLPFPPFEFSGSMAKVPTISCVECRHSIASVKGVVLTRVACANCRQAKWERRVGARLLAQLQRIWPAGVSAPFCQMTKVHHRRV